MQSINLRKLQPSDNPHLATIIRNTLTEFGVNNPGTVFYDDTTDHLYELFQEPGSMYYVAELDNKIVGGAGIYPSEGLPQGTCELVKMYLIPEARNLGFGRKLIDACIEFAKGSGYIQVYIETMPELRKALSVYVKYGFEYLDAPLGNTGHYGCDVWMLKPLTP